jgi:hypothetical protein
MLKHVSNQEKLGYSETEFENYLNAPKAPHALFATDKIIWDMLNRLKKSLPTIIIKKLKMQKN